MVKYAREDLLINVAKLYYESDYNQGMIAEKFNISRPFVSKLLHEAKERGIVTIHVHDPARTETRMEKEIRQKYELRRVIVVPSAVGEDTRARICAAGAKYLNGILKPGDIIGLGSGQTMYLSARCLTKRDDLSKITLVGLEGEVSNLQHSPYQQETIKTYADALGGVPYSMPLPAYLSEPAIKKILFNEPCIRQVHELQKRANIAVFTVSTLSTGRSMSFVRQGYFTEAQMKEYMQRGSIANVLHHFVNQNGEICAPELEDRNTCLSLNHLRQKEYRICLAAGRNKIDSVAAALNGNYINVLIADENIAEGILN